LVEWTKATPTRRDFLWTELDPPDRRRDTAWVTAHSSEHETFAAEVQSLGGDLASALANVRFPAYVLDREGRIRALNSAALELFGDARGRLAASLVADADREAARARISRKILKPGRTDYATTVQTVDGELVPVEVSSVSLLDADRDSIVGVFGMLWPIAPPAARSHPEYHLSPREQEVLGHLAAGCSTVQMAVKMGIAPDTVRNHVRRLFVKLSVHSRLEAVALVRRKGLVPD
jgi:PAS domain S-box-containing protein